jgi:3-isopropylmalate/(R)-2-methylmalate dehydratase small subunit
MKTFGGPVLYLDRDDINTDEIIPAKYLTEVTKEALRPYLLEDLKCEGFDRSSESFTNARVIVTRANFGCGSSREHAPWVFEVNAITVVIAESFARIFRQNMFNCGMLAIELPKEEIEALFSFRKNGPVACAVDVKNGGLVFSGQNGEKRSVTYTLSGFDSALVNAGGWVEYADTHY